MRRPPPPGPLRPSPTEGGSATATETIRADAHLVARCRAGDRAALAEFYRTHVRRVERLLCLLVAPGADLEDLVQTTFLEALRSLGAYRGEASLGTWLSKIAVHVARHHVRGTRRRRARLVLVRSDGGMPDVPDPQAGHERLEAGLDARHLHDLLDRLPAPRRVALVLHLVCGHTVDEVAALMGAGRFATRARLALGRRELRALVQEDPRLRHILAWGDDT